MVSRGGMSAVGTAVAADAPPASDKETPTTLSTGASFRHLRFEACFLCSIRVSHLELEEWTAPRHCRYALHSCLARRLRAVMLAPTYGTFEKGLYGPTRSERARFYLLRPVETVGTQEHRTLLRRWLPRAFVKGDQARGPAPCST